MLFKNKECGKCNGIYDSELLVCPKCGEVNSESQGKVGKGVVVLPYIKQLILFLIGSAGMITINLLFSIIAVFAFNNPLDINSLVFVNFSTYISLLIIFIIFKIVSKEKILSSFGKWQSYLIGLLGFIVLVGFSTAYSIIITSFHPGTNGNQQAAIDMILSYPILSLIVLGFIGPICEELTYRLGLFSFSNRLNKYLAYIISSFVFAIGHFDLASADIILELLMLPEYILSGIILAYIYDHYGLAASTTSHCLNNAFSIISILVSTK